MIILKTINDINSFVDASKESRKSIGFVPTMGALHVGHLSLIDRCKAENDITVCSIFVNPIQFNDPKDFEKYPRTEEADCKMLEQHGCDVVFMPERTEIYNNDQQKDFSFGSLEQVMEGEHRPGHFKGVAIIVDKLFQIVTPDRAYFGEKDYQQLKIIQKLVQIERLNIEIIPCPTLREDDGLAMSSRNMRLNSEQRAAAPLIFKTLNEAVKTGKSMNIEEIKSFVIEKINTSKHLKVEYFELADENSLQPINSWDETTNIRGFIAVFCGEVRLIDNIRFI